MEGQDGRTKVTRVIVPKGAGVPILQRKVNIFDKDVCKGLQWEQEVQKDNAGEHLAEGPGGNTSPEGKLPDQPQHDGYMSQPSPSVSGQADVPEHVQAAIAAVRTALSQ